MLNDTLNFISRLSFHKLFNILKAKTGYALSINLSKPFVWGMPYAYSIEPNGICNLSCPECPTGKGITNRNKAEISMELYQSLINQIAPSAAYLMLYLQGEPFLNKRIFEMITLANESKIYTCISTNGYFLDKQSALQTVTSGLDRIIISLDGLTNEVYQQYRKGGNFEKVLEGIKDLVDAKNFLKSQTPFIILQFIVFKHNQHQLSELKNFGHSLGINKTTLKSAQLYDFEKGHPMMTDIKQYSRYRRSGEHYVLRKRSRNSCRRIWTTGVITTDGVLVPCCYDKSAEYGMGNTETQDLQSIWNGELFKNYRKKVLQSKKEIEICCNCDE